MSITTAQVRAALRAVTEPFSGQEFAAFVKDSDIKTNGDTVSVVLTLGYPAAYAAASLAQTARQALDAAGVPHASVTVKWSVSAHAVQRGLKPLPTVRNIIAVASGKEIGRAHV